MASSLRSLPGSALLARLRLLVARGNAMEAELIAHLGEVESRGLHVGEACPSIFAYCLRVLHFSESVAYKRIHVARAARRHPELLDAMRRGDLHLTAACLLTSQLTRANCDELIRASRHKTAREIRELLADRRPRPDVPSSIRRIPASAAPEDPPASPAAVPTGPATSPQAVPIAAAAAREGVEPRPGIASSSGPAPGVPIPAAQAPSNDATAQEPHAASREAPASRTHREPLGGQRYYVRFTADREMHEQLEELRALMRHEIPDGDVGKILARAVSVLLERVRKRKFGERSSPRPAKAPRAGTTKSPSPGPAKTRSEASSRAIPAAIRRAVWSRDGGRCTYRSPTGRRCGAREFLEFHHREPWARTRTHSVAGISLRCRSHNQHEARRDFGERHMERFCRRSETNGARTGALHHETSRSRQPDSNQARRPREGEQRGCVLVSSDGGHATRKRHGEGFESP